MRHSVSRRFWASLLCLTLAPLPVFAMNDIALLAHLKAISFPLFQGHDPDEEIRCLGWNGTRSLSKTVSFYVTAAHCTDLRARNDSGEPFPVFPVQSKTFSGPYDQQVLLKPDCEAIYPKGFRQDVQPSEYYFALGHRSPKDNFQSLALVRLRFLRSDPEDGLIFQQVCTGDECQVNMYPGVSGSPVIDHTGLVVGSYRGFYGLRPGEFQVSPIDMLEIFLRSASQTTGQMNPVRHCSRKE